MSHVRHENEAMNNARKFLNVFIKKGALQGLTYAMMMTAGMWMADQPLSWVGFSIWLFGFAIYIGFVEYYRLKKKENVANKAGVEVAFRDEAAIIYRYQRDYKMVGFIFLACLLVPLPLYYSGHVDENAAWPFAIGLAAGTFLPLAYLKFRLQRNGGNIRDFLVYGKIKDGISPKWQILLFSVYAVASVVVVVIAIYQLFV